MTELLPSKTGISDSALREIRASAQPIIESGVATDMGAVCPVLLTNLCDEVERLRMAERLNVDTVARLQVERDKLQLQVYALTNANKSLSEPPRVVQSIEYQIGDRVNYDGHITEVVGVSIKYMLCGGAVVYGHDLRPPPTKPATLDDIGTTRNTGHVDNNLKLSEHCWSTGCMRPVMYGSTLCEKHYNALPAPMRGESAAKNGLPQGAVSVVKPQGTEDAGTDRSAAPLSDSNDEYVDIDEAISKSQQKRIAEMRRSDETEDGLLDLFSIDIGFKTGATRTVSMGGQNFVSPDSAADSIQMFEVNPAPDAAAPTSPSGKVGLAEVKR